MTQSSGGHVPAASADSGAYALNGQQVSAQTFYDAACDPRQSIAVEACAGAGKTWMLMTRIIRALEQGALADQILAITFTKKAAGEMRERLQSRLEQPEHRPLRERLLREGRTVRIATFHAWFAQLLKTAPIAVRLQMGLPLAYELLEDPLEIRLALERSFYAAINRSEALKADFAALLGELGQHALRGALEDLLAKRVEFELSDQASTLETSVASAQSCYPAYAKAFDQGAETNLDTALIEARPQLPDQLALLAKLLGQHHAKTLKDWAALLETGLSRRRLTLLYAALLTQSGEAKKLGKMKLGAIPAEWQTPNSGNSVEALFALCQAHLQEIKAVEYQNKCWQYQQRMTRIGRLWLSVFAEVKHEKGLVDMSDLERAATKLLSDSVLSGSIQERLDLQLRHVMIDEFQDTNPLQWQAIHAWLSSYAGSGGGGHLGQSRPSVFLVGDPKQSIYRFRRAEPRVFKVAQAFLREYFDAALLSCDHTRRCAPAVVDAINQVMPRLALEGAELGQPVFRPHTTKSLEVGAALCLPLIARPEQQDVAAISDATSLWRDSLRVPRAELDVTLRQKEALQAAQWISWHLQANRLKQPAAHASVIVLSRRHSSLNIMQQALQQRGISTQKQEKSMLADHPAVKDVLALVSCLTSPANDLDLAHALKSPLLAFDDAQLMALRALQLATQPLKPWRTYLPEATRGTLERWQTWLEQLPPHDALQAIFDDADIFTKYREALPSTLYQSHQQALKSLLWTALSVDEGRFLSADIFLRTLRQRIQTIKAPARSTDASAVQLLTIHSAKGLEADTVLLFDSDPKPKNAQSMTALIDWPPEESAPKRFVFLQKESSPPVCTAALLQADLQARAVEEVNALYVAMTRASQYLVVSAHEAINFNASSIWNRLHPYCTPISVPAEMSHDSQALETSPPTEASVVLSNKAPLKAPVRSLASLRPAPEVTKDTSAAAIGLALHRLLQWQTMQTDENRSERVAHWPRHELLAVAREFQLNPSALSMAHNMACAIANGEAKWLWDSDVIDWFANEYEFVSDGRTLRIDRLVKRRDTQTWWIVDFKSASQPERSAASIEQMNRYHGAVVKHLGASPEQVRAMFITGTGHSLIHNPRQTSTETWNT